MSHFWVMCFFLMKLTSQIRKMWIGIICIIGLYYWVNCWCGIVGDHVIGPYLFEGRLTASLRKLSAKRTASINGRRALACSHEDVDATLWCTTLLCSVFKTNDEWDFWRKVNRTRRSCSLATSFARSNITRLLFMGFCQRTHNGSSTYHAWRHERKNTPSMCRNCTTNFGWS